MESDIIYEKPKCKRCKSSYVYVKVDGKVVCRNCGYINGEDKS